MYAMNMNITTYPGAITAYVETAEAAKKREEVVNDGIGRVEE